MSTNKHAVIRYQTLDNCFRNPGRRYFIEDLVEACNNSIYEFTGTYTGIQKRQLFEDINQLKEALLTLFRFKGMPQFEWIDEMTARLDYQWGNCRKYYFKN